MSGFLGTNWFLNSYGSSDDSWAGLTESDADANTFVLEMEGTGTTEVGAGFGITSATAKTFTVSGTVDAVDADGYRRLNDGKFDFNTSPSEVLAGAFGGGTNTWFWGMKMKDVVSNSDNAFFNFIGGTSGATADASIYCAKTNSTTLRFIAFAGNGATNPHTTQTISFQPNSTYYVWLCHWSDGTFVRGGWVESATDDVGPKNYSDFPSTQRFSVSSSQGFQTSGGGSYTFYVQGGTGAGIGQNNADAKGEYRLNKFVISTNTTIVND